jgi:putative ABC transport system permease protein
MARIKTRSADAKARDEVTRRVEQVLADSNAAVRAVLPFSELRTAIGDHLLILVRSLVSIAFTFALVGILALATAIGTSVLERTREIGVMKTLGANRRRLLAIFLREGLVTGAISWVVAFAFALPLTAKIERVLGEMAFQVPLPFVVSPVALGSWFFLVCAFSLLAAWLPARRAAAITVREALAQL